MTSLDGAIAAMPSFISDARVSEGRAKHFRHRSDWSRNRYLSQNWLRKTLQRPADPVIIDFVIQAGPIVKGIPKCFCWPSVFLEAWGNEAKQTAHFPDTNGFLALPPKAAIPTNHSFLKTFGLLGLGAPGLQKNTRLNNHFGIL